MLIVIYLLSLIASVLLLVRCQNCKEFSDKILTPNVTNAGMTLALIVSFIPIVNTFNVLCVFAAIASDDNNWLWQRVHGEEE
jgi:Na+-driven multidrug efflux pump